MWERAVTANSWTPEQKAVMLPLYLQNRASQVFRNLTTVVKKHLNLVKKELNDYFNSAPLRLQARNLAGERIQGPRETVTEFYKEICKMVRRGWSTKKSSDYQKEKSLEYVAKGLRPNIKKVFGGAETEDLDVAFHKAYSRGLYLNTKKGRKEIAAIEPVELNAKSPKFIPGSCKPADKLVHVDSRTKQN